MLAKEIERMRWMQVLQRREKMRWRDLQKQEHRVGQFERKGKMRMRQVH